MSKLQDVKAQKSFKYLQEVETLAQDILTLKDNKLQLANSLNKFREALRSLEKTEIREAWLQMGSVYVKRNIKESQHILQNEINKAEHDINQLHEDIKDKVYKLQDLEHEPRLQGFTLKPISFAEAKALHRGFGLS